ncbi:unnamed protein product, partial [Polarella glacialis]
QRLQWFSTSLKKLIPVKVTKMDHAASQVIVTFEMDSKVWKSVPFWFLSKEECPLKGPLPGQEKEDSGDEEDRKKRKVARRSVTPDVWEMERKRIQATQYLTADHAVREAEQKAEEDRVRKIEEEHRRRAVQEAERQKVQEAFEKRKKEAEEQRLREEEEWRQRLVEKRKKEAEEEATQLAEEEADEEERQERKRKRPAEEAVIKHDPLTLDILSSELSSARQDGVVKSSGWLLRDSRMWAISRYTPKSFLVVGQERAQKKQAAEDAFEQAPSSLLCRWCCDSALRPRWFLPVVVKPKPDPEPEQNYPVQQGSWFGS